MTIPFFTSSPSAAAAPARRGIPAAPGGLARALAALALAASTLAGATQAQAQALDSVTATISAPDSVPEGHQIPVTVTLSKAVGVPVRVTVQRASTRYGSRTSAHVVDVPAGQRDIVVYFGEADEFIVGDRTFTAVLAAPSATGVNVELGQPREASVRIRDNDRDGRMVASIPVGVDTAIDLAGLPGVIPWGQGSEVREMAAGNGYQPILGPANCQATDSCIGMDLDAGRNNPGGNHPFISGYPEIAGEFTIMLEVFDSATGYVTHRPTVELTINESAVPTVTVTPTIVSEPVGDAPFMAEFEVRLSAAPRAHRGIVLAWETSNGDEEATAAKAGEDYEAASGTVRFKERSTDLAQTIRVPINPDDFAEDAEFFDIDLSLHSIITAGDTETFTDGHPTMGFAAFENLLTGTPVANVVEFPKKTTVKITETNPLLEPVENFLAGRLQALLANQPSLARLLDDDRDGGNLSASAGEGEASASGGFRAGGTWGEIAASRHKRGGKEGDQSFNGPVGAESSYVLGSFGVHRRLSERTLAGLMLQFDDAGEDIVEGGAKIGEVGGSGWMFGPYFAAKSDGSLRFEGRLLAGRTDNDIVIERGGREIAGSFGTTRWLAQLRAEGEAKPWQGSDIAMTPFLDASYASDRAGGFTDSLGARAPGISVALGRLEAGVDLDIPLGDEASGTVLRPGASVVLTEASGAGHSPSSAGSGARGRLDLGLDLDPSENASFRLAGFYDGIGDSGYEGYGLSAGVDLKF